MTVTQLRSETIEMEPGALDDVPYLQLVHFLAEYDVEIVRTGRRLVIRRRKPENVA